MPMMGTLPIPSIGSDSPITSSLSNAIWRVISLSELTRGITSSFKTTSRYSILVETPLPENWLELVGIAMRRPDEIVPLRLFAVKMEGRERTVKSLDVERRFT